jgi:hypothetical protein
MRQILSLSEYLTDHEVERLTTVLMFYLVEKSGGQVAFTVDDANRTTVGLNTKMLHMQIGNDITLKVITRPPELQEVPEER